MKYFGDIKVKLDEVVCLGISELLRSPSMGEFTREGYINGWKSSGYVLSRKCWRKQATAILTLFPPIQRRYTP